MTAHKKILALFIAMVLGLGISVQQPAAQTTAPQLYNTPATGKRPVDNKQVTPYSFYKGEPIQEKSVNEERRRKAKLALSSKVNAFTSALEDKLKAERGTANSAAFSRSSRSTSTSNATAQQPQSTRTQIYRPQNPAQGETPARLWNPR